MAGRCVWGTGVTSLINSRQKLRRGALPTRGVSSQTFVPVVVVMSSEQGVLETWLNRLDKRSKPYKNLNPKCWLGHAWPAREPVPSDQNPGHLAHRLLSNALLAHAGLCASLTFYFLVALGNNMYSKVDITPDRGLFRELGCHTTRGDQGRPGNSRDCGGRWKTRHWACKRFCCDRNWTHDQQKICFWDRDV